MKLPNNWKTTASGVCSLIYVICFTISGYLATLPDLAQHKAYIYTMFIIGLVIALCKALIGYFSQDAGTTLAVVPGDSTPQVVASHETPDLKTAKAIIPQP